MNRLTAGGKAEKRHPARETKSVNPQDLSRIHSPVSKLFATPANRDEWLRYRLNDEQVTVYEQNGYVSGISVLDGDQIEVLRCELNELLDPHHPGRQLFYEYNSNEAADPATILFHALGAWRVTPGFHDLLWNSAFLVAASQLLGGAVRFWHDQLFCKPAKH